MILASVGSRRSGDRISCYTPNCSGDPRLTERCLPAGRCRLVEEHHRVARRHARGLASTLPLRTALVWNSPSCWLRRRIRLRHHCKSLAGALLRGKRVGDGRCGSRRNRLGFGQRYLPHAGVQDDLLRPGLRGMNAHNRPIWLGRRGGAHRRGHVSVSQKKEGEQSAAGEDEIANERHGSLDRPRYRGPCSNGKEWQSFRRIASIAGETLSRRTGIPLAARSSNPSDPQWICFIVRRSCIRRPVSKRPCRHSSTH